MSADHDTTPHKLVKDAFPKIPEALLLPDGTLLRTECLCVLHQAKREWRTRVAHGRKSEGEYLDRLLCQAPSCGFVLLTRTSAYSRVHGIQFTAGHAHQAEPLTPSQAAAWMLGAGVKLLDLPDELRAVLDSGTADKPVAKAADPAEDQPRLLNATDQGVLMALENGPMMGADLADKVGIEHTSSLSRLIKNNLGGLVENQRGGYRLTNLGRIRLAAMKGQVG